MRKEREPAVYILASQPRGTLYIGVTPDLVARLWEHREGCNPGFTRRHGVVRLVYFERFAEMEPAIAREKQLKRWRRQWKINLIECVNPDWHDLAIGLGFSPFPVTTRQGGP